MSSIELVPPSPAEPEGSPDPMQEVQRVVKLLHGGGLYTRTALLLLPQRTLGREGQLAARLGLGYVTYQGWKLAHLTPDQNYLMYSAERLLGELGELCAQHSSHSVLLVSQFDLPLSALPADQRQMFWDFLFSNKRPRPLLLSLPHGAAESLLNNTIYDTWLHSGRLARLAE